MHVHVFEGQSKHWVLVLNVNLALRLSLLCCSLLRVLHQLAHELPGTLLALPQAGTTGKGLVEQYSNLVVLESPQVFMEKQDAFGVLQGSSRLKSEPRARQDLRNS